MKSETYNQTESSMMKQIKSIPYLMACLRRDLPDRAAWIAEAIRAEKIRKIILTGCGDSYCAAMAARRMFAAYTALEVEAVPVIELSRYYDRHRLTGTGDVLVAVISSSGNVSRCIELAKRVVSSGGKVLGVTSREDSRLSAHSSLVLKMDIPSFPDAPGIRSYTACICALYLLAVAVGRGDKTLEEAQVFGLTEALGELEAVLDSRMSGWERETCLAARRLLPCTSYEWIGSGPGYVNSWFAWAKLLETAGRPGGAYNPEDWFHMNYFIRDVEHTAAILFTRADGKDRSRAEELIPVAAGMGRPLLCITDQPAKGCDWISVPVLQDELLAVFVDYIPAAMLAMYAGELLQEVYFRGGIDRWTACADFATVSKSRELIEGDEG